MLHVGLSLPFAPRTILPVNRVSVGLEVGESLESCRILFHQGKSEQVGEFYFIEKNIYLSEFTPTVKPSCPGQRPQSV